MKRRNLLAKALISAFAYALVLNLSFNVMESSASAVSSNAAERETSILGQGTSGDIAWKVDSNGVLWLTGNGDYVLNDNRLPWHNYRESITSAVVDISGITNTSYMFSDCSNLQNLDVSKFDTANVTDMGWMFYGCSNLQSLDVSKFNTANVTDMGLMFYGCSNLQNLDVSKFDTANVTNMDGMFSNCSKLQNLDVSRFDTANVSGMGWMFDGCSNLQSLDVSKFDTANVIGMMGGMFNGCSNLQSLDVSKFDTANVTDMRWMFSGCSNLQSLDVSKFDTANVTDMEGMFSDCSNLQSLDVSKFDTANVTNMVGMFGDCSNLQSLDVSKFDTANVTAMEWMFGNCSNLQSVDVSKFDTANVTGMGRMFYGCSNLQSLDVSEFDTANVTDMGWMFSDCSNLQSLDVSRFDTANVTDMGGMFYGCSNLQSVDVSKFNTTNVTDIGWMFDGCNNLQSIDVGKFDTANVTNMGWMFDGCNNLQSIDVSKFDTANVTNMSGMFYGCNNLQRLDVSKFDTANVTDMGRMFYGCSKLQSLDVSKFDTANVTDMEEMFSGCSNLTTLHTPINVTQLVELPSSGSEIWYMDTTEVTHLPQNLNYSVKLVKEISEPESPNKVLVDAITISPSKISLKVGEKRTLSKSCTPSNADRQSVSWHSTDSDIVSVNNQGTVTGISEGTADIYCVSQDGGDVESNRCTVKVAGKSDIAATEIPEAMKYIPYSFMLQNSNRLSRNTSNYQIKSGKLPDGMKLKSDGELYGVPEEIGTFTFTVGMDNNSGDNDSDNTLLLSEQTFVLQVIENTDINIETLTDPGYELIERVPNLTLNSLTDQTMVSKGDYEEFVNLFLDGVKLERGADYTAEPGSTRITIKSQTLKRFNTPGTHTLAMEFRTKKTNSLRWAAQNYVISGNGNNNNSTKLPSRGQSSSRSSSHHTTSGVSQIIIDSKKGYVHIVTGIITGEGTGYSCWTQDENGWKLTYADRTLARGSIQQLENGDTVEQILWELINGSWYAFGADGSVKDGWVYDYQLGSWYCTSAESGMQVSWHNDSQDGNTYYLEPETGKLAAGWRQINDQWYYFNTNTTSQGWKLDRTTGNWSYNTRNKEKPFGAMYSNEKTPDGYYVNADGAWDGKEN